MENAKKIAYFSMEIFLDSGMPTYSGGLGILAGDALRAAADLKVPMTAVTLLSRKGYLRQKLDADGRQTEEPDEWPVERFLEMQPGRVTVMLEGRAVHVAAWKRDVVGITGYKVPVYFLDTQFFENSEWDRTLTDFLYGGDAHYRLCQEAILGIGGVRMLRALGHREIQRYHMNDGHPAFLTLELLDEQKAKSGRTSLTQEDIEAVRRECVFTTHTPVPAGHDLYPADMVARALGPHEAFQINGLNSSGAALDMTHLALNLSHYVNGVAKKHGEVSRSMYRSHDIDSITNGVHAATWAAKPFQELFDRHIPGWREDNFSLRYALSIPKDAVWAAHVRAKSQLIETVKREAGVEMDPETLTLGFARRFATYKRADLLLQDIARLKDISARVGRLQVVYAGKAHAHDEPAKQVIQRVVHARQELGDAVRFAYLTNYNAELGRTITSGVDVLLNTPEPPLEASGTSGMKGALNGVPSLSVLDGWWVEGCIEGITGWAIEGNIETAAGADNSRHAALLYEKLEKVVVPTFYQNRGHFLYMMLNCIALNGSFFNTQRMILQYVSKAYFL